MNVLNKIDKYINEQDKWKASNWIVQRRSDSFTYAILLKPLKNKSWSVVSIDNDREVAKKTSTKNWYPAPKIIDVIDVPEKLKQKVQKKLKQLGE